MKLTKTEQLLLNRLSETNYGRISYDGRRQSDAARKLEAKGLVKRHETNGTYFAWRSDGSYRRGYHPQGWIELV